MNFTRVRLHSGERHPIAVRIDSHQFENIISGFLSPQREIFEFFAAAVNLSGVYQMGSQIKHIEDIIPALCSYFTLALIAMSLWVTFYLLGRWLVSMGSRTPESEGSSA